MTTQLVGIATFVLAVVAAVAAQTDETTVTLVAFSDYHSHAVPFYSEGRPGQAGIARAIAYLERAKTQPNTLVLSGGDMLNLGSPTWSDEYRCIEWPWLSGLVDAMALGNHDLDYGAAALERCRQSARFPVLSANLLRDDGTPFLLTDGKPYLVREVGGLRIGLFAVAGPDMRLLVREDALPEGTRWADAIPTARATVETLRRFERVNAVVAFGHQLREDDAAMAREVPGIDLILGTHSHDKSALHKLPGTETYYISPYQYLAYVSEVRLVFEGTKLARVEGGLVKMDETLPEDPDLAAEVARLQAQLEKRRPERFEVLGRALVELGDDDITTRDAAIGNWATEVLRQEARTHVFFATASGFRAGIPPGEITVERLYTALPYENKIVTAEMSGAQVIEWVELSLEKEGSDGFCQQTGLRYRLREGRPDAIQILRDPAHRELGFVLLNPEARYRVGTSDFQAFRARGYRELFEQARNPVETGQDFHAALIAAIREGPIEAARDGRSGGS